ncbi:MAG: S8 family serine peptidase [Ruminococcus sp.]|nr:S8 family serine peptidase [Ruminococcus sp.]
MAVLATAVPTSVSAKGSGTPKVDYAEGEAIVVLKDSASSEFTKQKKAPAVYGSGVKLKNTYSFSKKSGDFRVAVLKSTTLTTKQILSNLKKNTEIKYAFPNYKSKITSITDDAYSDFQWALENKGQNNGTKGIDVKADALWDKASEAEEEKVVAVIDTGIDYTNEEFKDILWKNPYGSKLVGTCGADFSGTIADRKPYDDNGHGTHVAGIIAGKSDNGVGISGINKSNVKIMAVKAFDNEGYGYDDSILACFEYIERAIKLGTKISAIFLSLSL